MNLSAQVGQAELLPSEQIMARLVSNAQQSERGQRTLGTLDRLKIACDDIASGKAVEYAKKAGADEGPFRIKPPRINARNVSDYIKIRKQTDPGGERSWPGPHPTTLRANEDFVLYLRARQTEVSGFANRRKPRGKRAHTINQIAAAIHDDADRFAMMEELRKGREAQIENQLLRAGIPKLWPINVDDIIAGKISQSSLSGAADPKDSDRAILRSLISRLTDSRELLEFGLFLENGRVKAISGTGASLVSKKELSLLRGLALVRE